MPRTNVGALKPVGDRKYCVRRFQIAGVCRLECSVNSKFPELLIATGFYGKLDSSCSQIIRSAGAGTSKSHSIGIASKKMNAGTMKLDCIVLGIGGVGSPAMYFAAKKGWNVLGIDQFGAAHSFGSSHGQTRIIRTAYFEHPNYVPLAKTSFAMWDEIQAENSQNLINRTGLLQIGDPGGDVISGINESVNLHGLSADVLSPSEIMEKFPVLKVNDSHVGMYEKEAGYLRVERCVAAWVQRALKAGASIRTDTLVSGWSVEDNGTIRVDVMSGGNGLGSPGVGESLRCNRLIIGAGAWSDSLLPGLASHLQVLRKQQQWFQLDRIDMKVGNRFPCFLVENANGIFYGFPEIDHLGMKVAEHGGGSPVDDPLQLDRTLDGAELERVEQFIDDHFHHTRRRMVRFSQCMYTKTLDEHFVIDHVPDRDNAAFDNVVCAAGLSGHGFKFAPVIGQRLVGMLEGEQDPLFDFLGRGDRF